MDANANNITRKRKTKTKKKNSDIKKDAEAQNNAEEANLLEPTNVRNAGEEIIHIQEDEEEININEDPVAVRPVDYLQDKTIRGCFPLGARFSKSLKNIVSCGRSVKSYIDVLQSVDTLQLINRKRL